MTHLLDLLGSAVPDVPLIIWICEKMVMLNKFAP
jgi:hypothetical protein